jgi:hypothetical protein
VGPRTGLDEVEKRKFLTLPGHELWPLSRPACSQSLYQLCYPQLLFSLPLPRIIKISLYNPNKPTKWGYECMFLEIVSLDTSSIVPYFGSATTERLVRQIVHLYHEPWPITVVSWWRWFSFVYTSSDMAEKLLKIRIMLYTSKSNMFNFVEWNMYKSQPFFSVILHWK